ncbi:hypothetical protein FACS1894166_02290 [Bacilli bacterium]|nr:hypothetical protein FACS1894166_02290 [Bacilli bacterium]
MAPVLGSRLTPFGKKVSGTIVKVAPLIELPLGMVTTVGAVVPTSVAVPQLNPSDA